MKWVRSHVLALIVGYLEESDLGVHGNDTAAPQSMVQVGRVFLDDLANDLDAGRIQASLRLTRNRSSLHVVASGQLGLGEEM